MKKTKKMALWQAACLLLAYLVARYGLFSLHGMKQWPTILLALGIVYLLLAWWRKLPVFGFCVSGGYLLGLALGLAFAVQGTDPGGGATSNAWLIWLMVYQATGLLGWLWDLRKKRRA